MEFAVHFVSIYDAKIISMTLNISDMNRLIDIWGKHMLRCSMKIRMIKISY